MITTKSPNRQDLLLLLILLFTAACGFQVNPPVVRNNHDPLRPCCKTLSSSSKTRWTQPLPSGQRNVGCPRTTMITALCAFHSLSRREIATASQDRVSQGREDLKVAKEALVVKETALQATEKALDATKKAVEAKEREPLLIDLYGAPAPWNSWRILKLWLQDIKNTQTQVCQEDAKQDVREAKQDVQDAENALQDAQQELELCIQWTDDGMRPRMVPDFLMNREMFEWKSERFRMIRKIWF